MAIPPSASSPAETGNLVVDLTARLDQALRRADLLERRIAAWEGELARIKTELREFTGQVTTAHQETDRVGELERRLQKLENRSMQAAARQALAAPSTRTLEPLKPILKLSPDSPDHCALVFARWQPLEVKAGETVTLRVKCDGYNAGDEIEFLLAELGAPEGETITPVRLKLPLDEMEEATVNWIPPKPVKGGQREFTYLARGRGQEARSPVLIVRG